VEWRGYLGRAELTAIVCTKPRIAGDREEGRTKLERGCTARGSSAVPGRWEPGVFGRVDDQVKVRGTASS